MADPPSGPSPEVPVPAPPPPPAPSPYPAAYPPYGARQKTSGLAIAALVLSLLSFVMCPVIAAVIAIALAHAAFNRIDSSGGLVGGRGMAVAGNIIAWVNIALVTLAALGTAVGLLIATS
ncbi:MAG TPA: DUF4190 domain-containing protein [Acidimicrobiia bacterium]|jgi:hypothetical protein